jgi:EAL domain-containing protein (putative c-di-GMP-specific phosphodiesterase class I)
LQADFVQRVKEILATTGADPTCLTLEITESLLVEHASEAVARMTELAALGLRFAIDDFGTGYSSLAYLKRLPLVELKIDKSFVQDIPHDPNDVALVETILSMARHLHFEVVAEGVENEAQLAFLRQHGCERFQGFYFQRPLEMSAWIKQLPLAA